MKAVQIVPTLSITLNLGSAAVCLWKKDFNGFAYWLFAAGLTICVITK